MKNVEGDIRGQQISFLKSNIHASYRICICEELHKLCSLAKRYTYPFNYEEIPKNGIYILFEKSEYGHENNRIVRIGTHEKSNRLQSRIKNHFEEEDKNKSIFRKNLGRAMLNSENSGYLNIWNLKNDSQTRDKEFEKKIERDITNYIQNNFSFVLISEDSKDKRLYLESKLISTVSGCPICKPSKDWLGNRSPIDKIRKSGLWQKQGLYKTPLSSEDLDYIAEHMVIDC